MLVEFKYEPGQDVYLKTDPEQHKRTVTEIRMLPGGTVLYLLGLGSENSWHYDVEISTKENILEKIK